MRFRYRFPLARTLDSATPREVTIDWITIKEGEAGPAKVELELDPEIVVEDGTPPGWARAASDLRAEPARERPLVQFVEGDPREPGAVLRVQGPALCAARAAAACHSAAVDQDDPGGRRVAAYDRAVLGRAAWGRIPIRASLRGSSGIEARVDGRIADQVDYDQSTIAVPSAVQGDAVSRPALVELEFQEPKPGTSWRLPEI